ncbi:siderophore esteras-like protein IroE-like protein [Bimuria novae-zelandiae CBS 107.79]|uniref:Siderophore esteras-like protein IroE-like protein n=1 Tax=Bimuria novae-zelandiae CBS 107.79 TaxID=1447943 RepID=A0A6A5VA90_9PLEO|nr:siderophore esteras-like protein IroE-like protein [Bimuria novae-zelandiae CBS 107.79]
MSVLGNWTFTPLITEFPSTVLPNLGFWNASNGTWEYQIEVSWPLNWTSRADNAIVETLYVLDGNAQGNTAMQAVRNRRPVEFGQPDTIVVSLGYPDLIPDSPYSDGRYHDYQVPVCATCPAPELPGVPSNSENFIAWIEKVLKPWVQNDLFPNTEFSRDALHGHSFAGLFATYALITRPDLFDTFLIASPALYWNENYIFSQLGPLKEPASAISTNFTKPAVALSYGGREQNFVKRRVETQEEFEFRRSFLAFSNMTTNVNMLYDEIKNSAKLRDVVLHEYPFSDHAAVGIVSISDGLDYFYDWAPRIATPLSSL